MRVCPNAPPAMLGRLKQAKKIVENERTEALEAKKLGIRYPDLGPSGYDQTTITLFERLVEQPCMDGAWVTLSKVFDDTQEPPDTVRFANACNEIYKTWLLSPPKRPTEHHQHYVSLARDLIAIANKLVVDPEFGAFGEVPARLSVVDMLDDCAVERVLDQLESDLDSDGMERADIARACLEEVIPNFYEQARSLAIRCLQAAADLPASRQAGRATAGRTFFEQNLSRWLESHLGKSFRGQHTVVAAVASALFTEFDPVSSDNVRKVRRRPRANRKV